MGNNMGNNMGNIPMAKIARHGEAILELDNGELISLYDDIKLSTSQIGGKPVRIYVGPRTYVTRPTGNTINNNSDQMIDVLVATNEGGSYSVQELPVPTYNFYKARFLNIMKERTWKKKLIENPQIEETGIELMQNPYKQRNGFEKLGNITLMTVYLKAFAEAYLTAYPKMESGSVILYFAPPSGNLLFSFTKKGIIISGSLVEIDKSKTKKNYKEITNFTWFPKLLTDKDKDTIRTRINNSEQPPPRPQPPRVNGDFSLTSQPQSGFSLTSQPQSGGDSSQPQPPPRVNGNISLTAQPGVQMNIAEPPGASPSQPQPPAYQSGNSSDSSSDSPSVDSSGNSSDSSSDSMSATSLTISSDNNEALEAVNSDMEGCSCDNMGMTKVKYTENKGKKYLVVELDDNDFYATRKCSSDTKIEGFANTAEESEDDDYCNNRLLIIAIIIIIISMWLVYG